MLSTFQSPLTLVTWHRADQPFRKVFSRLHIPSTSEFPAYDVNRGSCCVAARCRQRSLGTIGKSWVFSYTHRNKGTFLSPSQKTSIVSSIGERCCLPMRNYASEPESCADSTQFQLGTGLLASRITTLSLRVSDLVLSILLRGGRIQFSMYHLYLDEEQLSAWANETCVATTRIHVHHLSRIPGNLNETAKHST